MKKMMTRRYVDLHHSAVHCWVIYFSPKLLKRFTLNFCDTTFDIACSPLDICDAANDMTQTIAPQAIQANESLVSELTIDPVQLAESIVYMVSFQLNANVSTMTVTAKKMPCWPRMSPISVPAAMRGQHLHL
ncbi:hypothetical protein M8994_17975 [Brucella sp. 21LCYQ03]|nr:hypothetical protein [Brucella sp. 21LCYQ03]